MGLAPRWLTLDCFTEEVQASGVEVSVAWLWEAQLECYSHLSSWCKDVSVVVYAIRSKPLEDFGFVIR